MKKFIMLLAFLPASSVFLPQSSNAQSVPTVTELNNFISGNQFLITYREGEAVYGTYYFMEIHYCATGGYGLYGKSVKQTVLGNEQHNNWQEYGNWQVMELNGNVGIYYKTTTFQERFVPIYRLPDGSFFIGEGITIVKQGEAICNTN